MIVEAWKNQVGEEFEVGIETCKEEKAPDRNSMDNALRQRQTLCIQGNKRIPEWLEESKQRKRIIGSEVRGVARVRNLDFILNTLENT